MFPEPVLREIKGLPSRLILTVVAVQAAMMVLKAPEAKVWVGEAAVPPMVFFRLVRRNLSVPTS
ncbi:MAG: hypothetical protein UY33_C0017G0039 [Candidatus Amesbacteria bacterium GW2011_GWA1_48_9]|uniref:Uncharacterized protein n=1 Tax=Candidatus Amesbacteria bacterium GW2011_GWA1_48_9 TaxID=1618355 RepID=A0A0G1Y0F4_9BACT|nr:MAG: hypothetical protein UY33_C0017G0039 [Candidatus Amesbacteria bacterium GW2011_GWA1_48_9]